MVNSGSFDSDGYRNGKARCTQASDAATVSQSSEIGDAADATCKSDGSKSTDTDLPSDAPAIEPTPSKTEINSSMPTESSSNDDNSSVCDSLPLEKVQGPHTSCSLPPDNSIAEDKPKRTRKLLCLYCDRSFVSANLRQKHVERVHTVKPTRRVSARRQNQLSVTTCVHCDKLNVSEHTLNDLFQHLVQEHPTKYFGCLSCEERFLTLTHLVDHNSSQHSTEEKTNIKRQSPTALQIEEVDVDSLQDSGDVPLTKVTRSKVRNKIDDPLNVVADSNLQTRKKKSKLKDLRSKKISVKTSKIALKRSKRLQAQTKEGDSQKKRREKKLVNVNKSEASSSTRQPEKPKPICVNPFPEFDNFYRVKKITDHSIDNLKISSLTFDDVFDKAFFNRIKCNIEENLLHHIDGKLFKNEESESRISNFEKISTNPQEIQTSTSENYGCELSLNAITPVPSLSLNSQFGEDFESQIEYGSKPSKKKTQTKSDEVHYKYFTRRKYQASILQQKENRDLSKLDMWTQMVVKERQEKILNKKKNAKELQEYTSGAEYKNKMKREELNRVLDRRGPFEDLKEEASKKAAFDKLNSSSDNDISQEVFTDVRAVLNEILSKVFEGVEEDDCPQETANKEVDHREIPAYLDLRRKDSSTQEEIDKSDRIALICSSQETENYELPTNTVRGKNEVIELTGEWARSRMYICAACGGKFSNMKYLLEHRSIYHQNVWVQNYEFVGNQSELYRHLSIPGLGKVGVVEETVPCKLWRRSDARMCTKCGKQCNSLGELHRHVLECGGDWTWMLARKKCKYRPFGTKSRRKRRVFSGLGPRIHNKRKTESSEKKNCKKPLEGPRQRPSDADTIQRMLANLPAKRSRRSLISLRDVVFKSRKTKQRNNTQAAKVKCGKTVCKKQNTETSNPNISQQRSSRSLRSLNKVLSSRILDLNSSLIVKRKLKVIRDQRSTKSNQQTKSNSKESTSKEKDSKSDSLPTQKRKSPKKGTDDTEISNPITETLISDKKKTLTKKILTNRLNIKNFFPIKKKIITSAKKNSILNEDNLADDNKSETEVEPTRKSIYLENSQNTKKNKRGGLKGLVRALSLRKRNSKYEEQTEQSIKGKNLETIDLAESNPVTKKGSRPKSKNLTSLDKEDTESPKTKSSNEQSNEDKGLSKKRKIQRGFRNVINKVKKIKTEKTWRKSDEESTLEDSSKEIQPFLEEKSLPKSIMPPEKVVTSAEVKENIQEKEDHVPIAVELSDPTKHPPIPDIVINVADENEKSLINEEPNCENAQPNLLYTIQDPHEESTSAAKENVMLTTDSSLLSLGNKVTPVTIDVTIDSTLKPKCVPLVSPNIKGKIKKPRGLNDCIAMLTSKLQHRDEKTSSSLESLFSTSSTTSMERTESRLLADNLSPPIRQQKNECILKIPTFKATKSPVVVKESALDLSKKYFSSPDLSFSLSSDVDYLESTINKVIEGVIEHKCKEVLTEKFAAPKWSSVDDIIQQVVQNSSSSIFSKPSVKKNTFTIRNNVDNTIDYVVNSSSDWFQYKSGSSGEKRKIFKKLRRRKKSDDNLIKDILLGKDKLLIAPSGTLHNAIESSLIAKIKENESKMSTLSTVSNHVQENIDKDSENNIIHNLVSNFQRDQVDAHGDSKEATVNTQEIDPSKQPTSINNEPNCSANISSEILEERETKCQDKSDIQHKNSKDGIENTLFSKEEQLNSLNSLNAQSKGYNVNESLVVKECESTYSNNNILQAIETPKKGKPRARRKGKKTQKQNEPEFKNPIIETCIDDCLNDKVIPDVESQPSTSNFLAESSNADGFSVKNKQLLLVSENEPLILQNKDFETTSKSLPSDSEDEIPLAVIAKQEENDSLKRNLWQNGKVLQISKNIQESVDSTELQNNGILESSVAGSCTPNLLEEVILDKNNGRSESCDPINLNKEIVENLTTDSLKENIKQAVSKNNNEQRYICTSKVKSLKTRQLIRPIKRKRRKITFGNRRYTRNKKKTQTNLNSLIKTVESTNDSSASIPLYITSASLAATKINVLEATKSELPGEDQSDLPQEAAVCNEPISPSDESNELVRDLPKSTEINEPIKILIHSQKTRRKSKSSKKIDKFDNDLFKDFSLVINKKTKRIPPTSIVDDSVCDDVLDKSINLVTKCTAASVTMDTFEEASEHPLIDSVEEMDMELEDIPINASIIERDNEQNITIKSYDENIVTPNVKVTIERPCTPNSEIQITTTRKSPRKKGIADLAQTVTPPQMVDTNKDSNNLSVDLNHRGARKGRKNKIDYTKIDNLENSSSVDASENSLPTDVIQDDKLILKLPSMDSLLDLPLEDKDSAVNSNNTDDTTTKSNVERGENEIMSLKGSRENPCLPIQITQNNQKTFSIEQKQELRINSMKDITTENILGEKIKSKRNIKQSDDFLENTETCEDQKVNPTVSPVQPVVTCKRNKRRGNKNKIIEEKFLESKYFEEDDIGKEASNAVTEKSKDQDAENASTHCITETVDCSETITGLENSLKKSSSENSVNKSKNRKAAIERSKLSPRKTKISTQDSSLNVSKNSSELLTPKKTVPKISQNSKELTEDNKESDNTVLESGDIVPNYYEDKLGINDVITTSPFQTRQSTKHKGNVDMSNEPTKLNVCQNIRSEILSKAKNNKPELQNNDGNSEFIDIPKKTLKELLPQKRLRGKSNNESSVDISTHESVLLDQGKSSSVLVTEETCIQDTLKTLKPTNNRLKNIKTSLNNPIGDNKRNTPVDPEALFPNNKDTEVNSEFNLKTKEKYCILSTKDDSVVTQIENADELASNLKNQFPDVLGKRRSPRKTKNFEKKADDSKICEQETASSPGDTDLFKMLQIKHLDKPTSENNAVYDKPTNIIQNFIDDSTSEKDCAKRYKNSEELPTHNTEESGLLENLADTVNKAISEENGIVDCSNTLTSIKECTTRKPRKSKNNKKTKEAASGLSPDVKNTLESKNHVEIVICDKREGSGRNKEKLSSAVGIDTMNDNLIDSSIKDKNIDRKEQTLHDLQVDKEFVDITNINSIKVTLAIENIIEDAEFSEKNSIEDSGFLERSLEESPINKKIDKPLKPDVKLLFQDSADFTGNQFDIDFHSNRQDDQNILEGETTAMNTTLVDKVKTLPKSENEFLTTESHDVIDGTPKIKQLDTVCELLPVSRKMKKSLKKNLQEGAQKLPKNVNSFQTKTGESPKKVKSRKAKKHQREFGENHYDGVPSCIDNEIPVTKNSETLILRVEDSLEVSEPGTEKANQEKIIMNLNQPPEKPVDRLLTTYNEQDSSASEQLSNDASSNLRRSSRNRSTLKHSDEVSNMDVNFISQEINSDCNPKDSLELSELNSTKTPEINVWKSTRTLKCNVNINHEIGKNRRSRKNINYNEDNLQDEVISITNFAEIQEIKKPIKNDGVQCISKKNKRLQNNLGVNKIFPEVNEEKKQEKVNQEFKLDDSRKAEFSEMPKLVVDLELIDEEYDGLIKFQACNQSNVDASLENLTNSNINDSNVDESGETYKESENAKELISKDISEGVITKHKPSKKEKRMSKKMNSDKLGKEALYKFDMHNETARSLNIFDFEETVSTAQDIIDYKKCTRRSAKSLPEVTKQLEQVSPVTEVSEKHDDSCYKTILGRRSRKNVDYNEEKWEPFADSDKQDKLISAENLNKGHLDDFSSVGKNNKKHMSRSRKISNSRDNLEKVDSVETIIAVELLSPKTKITTLESSETRSIGPMRSTRKTIDHVENLPVVETTVVTTEMPKDKCYETVDTSGFNVNTSEGKRRSVETFDINGDKLLNIDNFSDINGLQLPEDSESSKKQQMKKGRKPKKHTERIEEPRDTIEESLALPETVWALNSFDLIESESTNHLIKCNKTNKKSEIKKSIKTKQILDADVPEKKYNKEETSLNGNIAFTANLVPPLLPTDNIKENSNNTFQTIEISSKEITDKVNSSQVDSTIHKINASDLSETSADESKISTKVSKFKKPRKNIMDIDVANILDTEGCSENRRSSRTKRSLNNEKPMKLDQAQSDIDEPLESQISETFSWSAEPNVKTADLKIDKKDLIGSNLVKDSFEHNDECEDLANRKEVEPEDTSLDSNESIPLLDRMAHFLKNFKNKPNAFNNSNTDVFHKNSNSFSECVPDILSSSKDSLPIISVSTTEEALKSTKNSVSQNLIDESIHSNLDAILPLSIPVSMEDLMLESKSVTKSNKSKAKNLKGDKFNESRVVETKNICENDILAEDTNVNSSDVLRTEQSPDQKHQLAKINIKNLLLSSLSVPRSDELPLENEKDEFKNESCMANNSKQSESTYDGENLSVSQSLNTAFKTNTPKLKGKRLKGRKSKIAVSTQNLKTTKNKYEISKNLNFNALKNVLSTITKPGKRNKRKKTEDMFSEIKPLTDIITSSEMDIAPVLDEIDKSLESEAIYDFNEEELTVKSVDRKNNKTNNDRLRSISCPKSEVSNNNRLFNETLPAVEQTEMLLKAPTRINSKRSTKIKALENIHKKTAVGLDSFGNDSSIATESRKSRRRSKSLNTSKEVETGHLSTDNESNNCNEKSHSASTVPISFSIPEGSADNTEQTNLPEQSEVNKMEDDSYAKETLEKPTDKNDIVENVSTKIDDLAYSEEHNKTQQSVNQNNNLQEIVESENQINSLTNCQELRRSRRGSRKVASYNENDLIDPLIDALENTRNRGTKKDKLTEKHSAKKDVPKDLPAEKRKLNSEELFDLLKNSSFENLNILKPRNSFLENLNEPNSATDFQDITDEEFDNILEKPSLILTDTDKIKDIDKIYEFNDDSPENTEQVKEFGVNKRKITTSHDNIPSESKVNSVCNNSVENSLSSYASKEKDVELEKSNYCEICKKTFIRLENLIKHKTTLTHISKLSELEAKEAEERARLENEKQSEEQSPDLILKTSDSLRDEINIRDILQKSERTQVASTQRNSPSVTNHPLNLVDIISDVLNKPVLENFNSEKHVYGELATLNTDKSDIRRYKSLGERKSFESETQLSRISTPLSESYLPSAMSKTTILENQIHLLENIIGNKLESLAANKIETDNNFIDEVSSCSNNSNISAIDNNSCVSNRSAFNLNPENISANIHSNFIKPTHYEEISEDSANARVYEDLKLRKTLNRDEELFLECCSLLKSGSEVSNSTYSKNAKKTVDHLKESEEPELLENKKLMQTVEEAREYSDNSRTPTPLGDTYDDEASNSNTISSNWNLKSEKPLDKNRSFSFEEVVNKEEAGISFGEILTKGLRNQFEYMPKSDERTEEEFQEARPLKHPALDDRKDDSDCSSTSKKISTKGARKVFEGLRVSIPTEDLNLDVLNTSMINKKLESNNISPSIENQSTIHNKPRSTRKSKPVKKAQVGSNLLFKVNKKKTTPKSNTDLPKKQDIFNFEETQDNTGIFTKPLLKDHKIKKSEGKEKIATLDSDNESLGYADSIGADAKSVSSVSSISAMSTKKPEATPENITKNKYKIMGKIFKNAAKTKLDEINEELRNIPEIPEIDNLELVQNYVRSCQRIKSPFLPPPPPPTLDEVPKKPKMTEEEMNMLFDQLLGKEVNELKPEKPINKVSITKNKADNKTVETKKKVSKIKNRKRARVNSESSDDEFNINKTAKKRNNKKNNQEDSGINLELELKECIGVASRKSQRKCTSGKQNILVEYWSSDEEAFEAMLNNSQKVPPKKDEENKKTEQKECAIEELPEKEPQSEVPPVRAEKLLKPKPAKRKTQSSKKSKTLLIKNVVTSGSTPSRRKRAAANPLYHWSSSSEDESQSLIEVKPVREEDDEEDRPIQHGWIVGDSPKKLVTMLALTKGKKTDIDSVKEQGKRRTLNTVS